MDIFPVDWRGQDHTEAEDVASYEIHCFGKTAGGEAVLLRISFIPSFLVRVPSSWSETRQRMCISTAVTKLNALRNFSTLVKRIPFLGFCNVSEAPFLHLAFSSHSDARKAKYGVSQLAPGMKLQTYEASLDPLLRFFHVRGIDPADWITADMTKLTQVHESDTGRVSIPGIKEFKVDFRAISKCKEHPVVCPPLIIASWDLECVSGRGMFPTADRPEDKIITIGTAFQRYGEEDIYHRTVVTLGSCTPIDGVEVIACETEEDAVNAWLNLLQGHGVDIMCGYNTFGFDFKYLDGRSVVCVNEEGNPLIRLHQLGKSAIGGGVPIEKNLSSSAYGDNKYFMLSSPGILQLDLLQIFRKELKLESYSLANVSKKFLDAGEEKLDLKPSEIFSKFEGSADDRADIATYCIRDVELPLKLMRRLATLENVLEMANATCVPIEYLQTRGQQIRVYSLLTRKARSLNFAVPDMSKQVGGTDQKYEGATVLEARKGAYFDPICALDFASLYPSIIRAHNLCPSTLVLDTNFADIPGVEYFDVQTGQGVFKFAQDVTSVIPALLTDLARFRKEAKKDMANAKQRGDTFQSTLYNAKQLAFKVSMNSVYGFFGAIKGLFPCIPIASSVTATGRAMIEHSKAMAERLAPGSVVIYGDSVAEYTPTIVKDLERGAYITTFKDLASNQIWTPCTSGKEYCTPEQSLLVWTEKGWTQVHRLMRHRLDPGKRVVRVSTSKGFVDVTTDHSLLLPDGTPVRPSDISLGTALLHAASLPPDLEEIDDNEEPTTQLGAAKIFAWGQQSGLHSYVTSKPDGTIQLEFWREAVSSSDVVQSMQFVSYSGEHVYDMTTDNGHFAAGVGTLIVHNTDSILCRFKVDGDLGEHFKMAQWVADKITATFKPPVELEFEKVYMPYLLFSKKRYAGQMYTNPVQPDYIDVKGLQLVRRDNAPIVKDVSAAILDAVMKEQSVEKAIEVAQIAVQQVLNNEVPLSKYVISKALRASYANPASQPHVAVAAKLKQRRGYPVAFGERVPYVYVSSPENADGLLSTRAEDPDYVREHPEVSLDALYYIENQLMSPITTLLEIMVPDVQKAIMEHPDIKNKIEALKKLRAFDIKVAKRVRTNKSRNQQEITTFFKKA